MYFVYAELRQNSTIARAELNVFVNQQHLDIQDHFSDPDFVEIYLKGLDSAEQLNAAERRQLSEFYGGISNIFGYEYRNYQLGIFVEYEALPRILVRRYMTGQFARAWWEVQRESAPEAVRLVVDDELSKSSSKNLELQLVGEDYLTRFFPFERRTMQRKLKALGTSYRELLHDVRIAMAMELLANSDISMTRLAERLCYTDLANFTKAFSEHAGVPPSTWRTRVNSAFDSD